MQMVKIANSPRRKTEDQLRQRVHRLQILHEIDHAALSVQSEVETSAAALRYIAPLVPGYRFSMVCLLDPDSGLIRLLASDGENLEFKRLFEGGQLSDLLPASTASDLDSLRKNQPYIIQDLQALADCGPAGALLLERGIRSMLAAPLCWDGELRGLLNLFSTTPDVFPAERARSPRRSPIHWRSPSNMLS